MAAIDAVLGLLVLAALFAAWWRRRSLLDWYAGAYVALLLCYFTFADRLLLPLMPLVFSALVDGSDALGRGLSARSAERTRPVLRALPTLVLALVCGGVSLAHIGPALAPTVKKENNFHADRITAEWIREHTPQGARILHEKGSIIGLLSGRPTFTYRNLPGPWPEGCPEVDWVVLGPRLSAIETAVAALALERTLVPVRWFGERAQVRAYRMR